jgi:hypothetical protein
MKKLFFAAPVRHGPPHRHELLGEDQRRALPGPLAFGQYALRFRNRLPLTVAAPQASSFSQQKGRLSRGRSDGVRRLGAA